MSEKLEIIVSGPLPRPEVELTPAAYNAREVALAASGNVRAIATVTDLDNAAAALTTIKALTKTFESAFKEAKAPVLDVGRRLDGLKNDYLSSLDVEAKRLSVMVGSYQEAERRKGERIRHEEAARQAAALVEMQAKQAKAMATGDVDAADAARAEAADTIAASQMAVTAAEGVRAGGIVTRTAWKFEVEDIYYLFKSNPDLCLIEPNNAAIRALLKATNGKPIPGLWIWQETGAIVRGAAAVNVERFDY
jgi:hypothetical protein